MINLKQYGYIEKAAPPKGLMPARIVEVQRDQYAAITDLGEVAAALKGSFLHKAKGRSDFPCVGDFVFLQHNPVGVSQIAEVLPRHSKFARADFSGHAAGYAKTIHEQVIASNFDYVFVLSSLNADFNVNRIERYVIQARQSGGLPVVILNKADLVEDFAVFVEQVAQAVPSVPIHAVSAHTGFGLEALDKYMQPGKTAVFLGMSGVGKSSLLNAFMGTEVAAVQGIRESDSRGRHTTTHRQLFMLPCGALIIDTPGMRELGLLDAGDGIGAAFSDVEDLFTQCRFTTCGHDNEPGCAVTAALADGKLSDERWERYLQLAWENEYVSKRRPNRKKMGESYANFSFRCKRRRRWRDLSSSD